jgi:hypothetical protein
VSTTLDTEPQRERRKRSHLALIGSLIFLLSAIAGIVGGVVAVVDSFAERPEKSEPSPIAFDLEDGAEVPRCAALQGQAPSIEGEVLWVAYAAPDGWFFMERVETHADGAWAAELTIGGPEETWAVFFVYVFYLDRDTSAALDAVRPIGADGGPGNWYSESLPASADQVSVLEVRRDATPDAPYCDQP